jgi:hypothetical protein
MVVDIAFQGRAHQPTVGWHAGEVTVLWHARAPDTDWLATEHTNTWRARAPDAVWDAHAPERNAL